MRIYRISIPVFLILIFSYCNEKKDSPNLIIPEVIMPDTTSHEFEWQIDYFGDGASSRLQDVCIIDEDDIWAVGEIYLKDSLGVFKDKYNVVHWDGVKWNVVRIQFPIYGTNSTAPFPARAVFSFDSNQVWFTSAGTICIKKEESLIRMSIPPYLLPGSINKIWGIYQEDVYIVGNKGTIIHYNGATWQKLNSGTSLDIQDIWGAQDSTTGEYTVLAVAGNMYESYDRAILKIDGTNVEKFSDTGINWTLKGVWFDPGRIYYVVGAGIYSKETLEDSITWGGPGSLGVTNYYSYAVRGNHINDVFVVGAYGEVLHYNGNSWHSYRNETEIFSGSYRALAVKGDLVCAVGYEGNRAIILRGKRIK